MNPDRILKTNPQPMLSAKRFIEKLEHLQAVAWNDLHRRPPPRTIKVVDPDGKQRIVSLNAHAVINGECEEVPVEPKRIGP